MEHSILSTDLWVHDRPSSLPSNHDTKSTPTEKIMAILQVQVKCLALYRYTCST